MFKKELPLPTDSGKKLNWTPEQLSPKVEKISPVEEEVFRRLVPKFQALRINMDEFGGVYPKKEIERDKQDVKIKKTLFEDSPFYRRAQILEALLAEQIELSDWFGESATTIVPAEIDDLYHGVDLATEFPQDNADEELRMGLDVTVSKGLSLTTKLLLIKSKIEKGELTEMKYFASESLPDFRGRKRMPSIIIGLDPRTINELASLWLMVDRSKNPNPDTDPIDREILREQAREAQQKLAHHRAQVLILKEIELQLEAFSNLARKTGHSEIASQFEKLLALTRKILSKKKISKADEIANDSDDTFRALRKNLEENFN